MWEALSIVALPQGNRNEVSSQLVRWTNTYTGVKGESDLPMHMTMHMPVARDSGIRATGARMLCIFFL